MQVPELDGPRLHPITGKAEKLVIILHGYGADGADLMSLAEQWQALMPDAQFVAPNAPHVCGNNPMGYEWFALNFTTQGVVSTPQERREGAEHAAPAINAFIDAELDRSGLQPANLSLVGFSQGAMMALHVGLRRALSPAVLVSFSGMLLEEEPKQVFPSKPPVFLAHGTMDEVVPFASMDAAEKLLKAANIDVTSHLEHGVGHGIDGEAVHLAGEFIARHIT